MTAKTQLIADLYEKPRSIVRDAIIVRTMRDEFHDFKSEHTAPKTVLISELTRAEFPDLANKARKGDYDDVPDEEDEKNLRAVYGDATLDALKSGDMETAFREATKATKEQS